MQVSRFFALSGRAVWRAADVLWVAFLVWTAIGFVIMPMNLGVPQILRLGLGDTARATLITLLNDADAFWMILAASNVYLYAVEAEGLATARIQAAIILVVAGLVEWIGVRTGEPFGSYRYTARFGWRLGGVLPAAIPLAWLVILLCAKYAVRSLWPEINRYGLALAVGTIAVLTDLNLEYVAWKVRGYWIWYPTLRTAVPAWPPVQNYASWFVLSAALTWLLPESARLGGASRVSPRRPILILGLMNALFLATRLAGRTDAWITGR